MTSRRLSASSTLLVNALASFPDLFISYVVSQANALYPPQHSNFHHIHQPLILLFHCPAFIPICHSMFYNSLNDFCLSLTGTFLPQITPVTSLHLFQASMSQLLESAVDPHSQSNIDLILLKVITYLISFPPSLTSLS